MLSFCTSFFIISLLFLDLPKTNKKSCLPKQGGSCQAHCWPHTCNPDVSYCSSSEPLVQRWQFCCQWSRRRALETAVALTPGGLRLPPSCISIQPVSRLDSCRLDFYTTSPMKTWDSFSDLCDVMVCWSTFRLNESLARIQQKELNWN